MTALVQIGFETGHSGSSPHPYFCSDAGGMQSRHPLPCYLTIGVKHRDDDTSDTRLDDSINTGRRPPPVTARLQGSV
jgi:hypothetical protein